MTDNLGAGLWYVTMVKFGDMVSPPSSPDCLRANRQKVKYGILSTPTLTRDLQHWETLYVAGRLHKPVLTLACAPSLSGPDGPLAANTRAALALALLQLPGTFTELALWEKIAGISYSGDPRMSVPGAENPEKVRNIVRGPGVLGAFRGLYAPHLGSVGLRWAAEPSSAGAGARAAEGGEKGLGGGEQEMVGGVLGGGHKGAVVSVHSGDKAMVGSALGGGHSPGVVGVHDAGMAGGVLGGGHEGGVVCEHKKTAVADDTPAHTWHGDGSALLTQPTTPEHAGALLASLPLRVRQRLAAHFRPTVAAALISREVAAERRDVRERRRAAAAAKESRALYDDEEFWRRVAGQKGFVEVVNNGESGVGRWYEVGLVGVGGGEKRGRWRSGRAG